MIEAIHRVALGERIITSQQFSRAKKWQLQAGNLLESLTNRERKILKLISQGLDNPTIAKSLYVSRQDVAYHVTNILGKLDVNTRQKATAWLHKYFPDDIE